MPHHIFNVANAQSGRRNYVGDRFLIGQQEIHERIQQGRTKNQQPGTDKQIAYTLVITVFILAMRYLS